MNVVVNKYGFDILIKNKSYKLHNISKKMYKYKLYNLKLYYTAINWLVKNKNIFKVNLPVYWMCKYNDEFSHRHKNPNLKYKDILFENNIIKLNGVKYLSINDNFSQDYNKYIYTDNIIINDIFNNNYLKKKYIKILTNKKYKRYKGYTKDKINNNNRIKKFKNVLSPNKIYKVQYLKYYEKNNKSKVLPPNLNICPKNINKAILDDKFDIGIFMFKKYDKNPKFLTNDYYKDFYKLSQFSLKNLNKNGCVILPTHECFHKNYLNYICYLTQYFKKISVQSYNNDLVKLTYLNNIYISGFGFNGKKIKEFNPKYNYNDKISLEIKKAFVNFIQNNINQLINDYLNIKDTVDMDLEQLYLNNRNNIKLFLIKNNIKSNILIDEYFNKYDTILLFDLNFFIKICIENNITDIYCLEYCDYVKYLIEMMRSQYNKEYKYIKYTGKEKINQSTSLIYINESQNGNKTSIISHFNNILIKKDLVNALKDHYVKEMDDNYYFFNKNEFKVK